MFKHPASLIVAILLSQGGYTVNAGDLNAFAEQEAKDWPNAAQTDRKDIWVLGDDKTAKEGPYVRWQYYTKRQWQCDGEKVVKEKMQFHGECQWQGATVADEKAGAVKCQWSMTPSKADKDADLKDWTELSGTFEDGKDAAYACKDGTSAVDADVMTPDTITDYNCMVNAEKSKLEVVAGKAKVNAVLHFRQEFDQDNWYPDKKDAEDLVLTDGGEYLVDLLFTGASGTGESDPKMKQTITLPKPKAASCEKKEEEGDGKDKEGDGKDKEGDAKDKEGEESDSSSTWSAKPNLLAVASMTMAVMFSTLN